jgi:excisionase family DNA binding protein
MEASRSPQPGTGTWVGGVAPHTEIPEPWRCLTIVDAARYLSLSRSQLYVLLDTNQVASFHIGRSRRIPIAELERFVRARLAAVALTDAGER